MEPEKKQGGAFIGIAIIVIILIIGGIYIWQSKARDTLEENNSTTITPLDSAELDTLDKELNEIDTDIDVDVDSLQ